MVILEDVAGIKDSYCLVQTALPPAAVCPEVSSSYPVSEEK